MIKEKVVMIISKMDFSEGVEEKRDCPKCKSKGSVIRNIAKEPQQGMMGKWFVEHCTNDDCDHWDCGFI